MSNDCVAMESWTQLLHGGVSEVRERCKCRGESWRGSSLIVSRHTTDNTAIGKHKGGADYTVFRSAVRPQFRYQLSADWYKTFASFPDGNDRPLARTEHTTHCSETVVSYLKSEIKRLLMADLMLYHKTSKYNNLHACTCNDSCRFVFLYPFYANTWKKSVAGSGNCFCGSDKCVNRIRP